ncbi:hypothetical protein QN277_026243 [Acacia crassicarpa]|uniref:Uncharacterized protein n=1 Tax=Acacia crassicarpa TaxID=499986 RepID=A0AAE1JAF3_9FABA|nr:hypothetical protein QN277_026243 [Acacia crassicarpa]
MNYMIWNSWGTSSRSFSSLVREINKYYKLDFLAILETRSNVTKSKRKIRQLGFSKYSFTAAEGYSGGIWCLWEEVGMKVEVMEIHKQYMHFQIDTLRQGRLFFYCGICKPEPSGQMYAVD